MKKILIFAIAIAMSVAHAGAAVRDGNATQRTATQKRISTTQVTERTNNGRTTAINSGKGTTNRSAATTQTTGRAKTNVVTRSVVNTPTRKTQTNTSRAATTQTQTATSETRTGAIYETCKSAFFTCMDQFCALKNDDYRRCSCSNRVNDMDKQRDVLNDAGEQLTVFTENLDVVGLTAAQAKAMKTASEGENALAKDTSASKALLQAIMNSISGGDTKVSGKYSDLNTINMSYDLTTIFGADANQVVASYNGQELYSAVYSRCRHAVAEDCNNASLQRAVNAYLMAIEQDCNTVQTAIDDKKAQMKSAIREGSAMLDLARVENRKKHNSDDITTCINNVESAILSEEVCGANYHKCLDNGEFIDISTGAPIIGVVKFYELGKLLTFTPGVEAANQRLSKRSNNRTFVLNFEKRTKKFAEPALDKCVEIADEVWSEYLDKAMLAIYYAQQAKVSEIKQGCFDFVSNCYEDSDASITAAMSELIGSGLTILQPDKIALTTQMCTDYVESCNNMFDGKIIEEYVNMRQDEDIITACRAVVKQCFDKYGGSGYENFYYPYSGLFSKDDAGDWFTLYDLTVVGDTKFKSPCANQLTTIDACNDDDIIEEAFGGFDKAFTKKDDSMDQLSFDITTEDGSKARYGSADFVSMKFKNRVLRPVGVATEIYNQIIDTLATQCKNIQGHFVERQFIKENLYGGRQQEGVTPNICLWFPQKPQTNEEEESSETDTYKIYKTLATMYGIFPDADSETPGEVEVPEDFNGEDMCPRDYNFNVDTSFWGACLCWENGGRRSKNGKSAICVAELPAKIQQRQTSNEPSDPGDPSDPGEPTPSETGNNSATTEEQTIMDSICYSKNNKRWRYDLAVGVESSFDSWCTQYVNSDEQVCPYGYTTLKIEAEEDEDNETICVSTEDPDAETPTPFTLIKYVPKQD